MMKEASEDEEQLRPANSSEDVPFVTHAVSPMWRSFAIAIVACVFGILAGVTFHSPRPPPPPPIIPGEGGGHHMHHHFVTEYDLVTIRYETPMAFETDVKGLGVTDKEYKACKSSILQDPNRKICTKPDFKCYKKKLKYEPDANGDIQPTYVKEGATEIECPKYSSCTSSYSYGPQYPKSTYENQLCIGGTAWPFGKSEPFPFNYAEYTNSRERQSCTARLEGTSEDINICYYEFKCLEEESQWDFTATCVHGEKFQLNNGDEQTRFTWPRDSHNKCAPRRFSWQGGLNPANVTYENPTPTTGYTEGKFCLQKAALKALSRRGWELIQPSEAFEPHGYYGYTNAWLRDIYASKTFKIIKQTLTM